MEFTWNEKTIGWYQRANAYTGFYKNIAALIAPKLAGYSTLCDIGCGLGLVDLELSASIGRITCIDINKEAILALTKRIEEKKISNIRPCLLDYKESSEKWDVIYVSFFGGRHLEEFLPRCKKLIAVINGNNEAAIYPQKYRKFRKSTVAETEKNLLSMGISYTLTEVTLEFGQPLSSMEEAEDFVLSHCPQINSDDLKDFLAEQLLETGEDPYPLFLPHKKGIGIFEIAGLLLD